MALTAVGSIASSDSGGWGFALSQERREQVLLEAEAAFRARCSAFLLSAVEAVRSEWEMCLSQGVEEVMERYNGLLRDALHLRGNDLSECGLEDQVFDTSSCMEMKMEEAELQEVVGVTEECKEVQPEEAWSAAVETSLPVFPGNDDSATNHVRLDSMRHDHVRLDHVLHDPVRIEPVRLSEESGSAHGDGLVEVDGQKVGENAENLCELCGKTFSRSSHLIRHRLIHTGERPFVCLACGKRFSQKVHLKGHLRTHRTTCGAAAANEAALRPLKEEQSSNPHPHSRQPPTMAPLPNQVWGARENEGGAAIDYPHPHLHPQLHPQLHPHPLPQDIQNSAPERNHCPVHSHVVAQPFPGFQRDVRMDMEPPQPPPPPPLPPQQVMTRRAQFNRFSHNQMQGGPNILPSSLGLLALRRRHRCGECGKAFTRASHLNRHRLTHTGERPHLCASCGKAFSQKVHLQAHLRRHHKAEAREREAASNA